MTRKKFVTIETPGKISELGGIIGPIKTPSYMDLDVIISLINSGKVVYEVNPTNVKDRVRLTRSNVLKHHYIQPSVTQKRATVVKHVEHVSPSNINTNIQKETKNSMVEIDVFTSNKYS